MTAVEKNTIDIDELKKVIEHYKQLIADNGHVRIISFPFSFSDLENSFESCAQLSGNIGQFEHSLFEREQVLGPDHLSTLQARDNLASAYRSTGQLKKAIEFYELNHIEYRRVLGANHASTLQNNCDLAFTYELAGQLEKALEFYELTIAVIS